MSRDNLKDLSFISFLSYFLVNKKNFFQGLFLRFGVMLGIKNEVLQQNKNLSGEDRSNNNTTNISSIGGVNNIPNQILLLNKNGAAN